MKYFDLHCDTLYRCLAENLRFDSHLLSVNAGSLVKFSEYKQCFAIWTPPDVIDKPGCVIKAISIYQNNILPCKSKSFTPLLSVEGADFLQSDYSVLDELLSKNIFSFSLTWNNQNHFAGGALSDGSLTQEGIRLIFKLNEHSIPLDVSHLNRKSFYKAVEYADRVIASHTFINDLTYHKRNLTLEQLKIIKQKNGLVGLCFYPEFLGGENIFLQIYKAIRFCEDNDLLDVISFGSDFDGGKMPITLSDLPNLYQYLSDKKIDKKTLDMLMFDNANTYNLSLTNGQSCDKIIRVDDVKKEFLEE